MTQRNGPAIEVDDLPAHTQDPAGVDRDRRERLVYLHEVEIGGAPTGLLERACQRFRARNGGLAAPRQPWVEPREPRSRARKRRGDRRG